MKKAIISIAVIVLIVGAAFAARPKTAVFVGYTGYVSNISGTTTNCIRIPGAKISIITSLGDTLRTVSDETASFLIPKMPEGPATIKIEAEGYKTQIQILDVTANKYGRYFKRFDMEKAEAAANGETDKAEQE